MTKLRECPFCGERAELHQFEDWERGIFHGGFPSRAICEKCEAKGPLIHDENLTEQQTKDEALKAWSTRHDEWRPIESMPNDTKVLLFEMGDMYAGEWDSTYKYWISYCGQHVMNTPEPTHWKPLPQPPKE